MGNRSRYSALNSAQTYYTKGNEYSLDGANYIGEYHIKDEIVYTGPAGPSNDGAKRRLTKYYADQNNYNYDRLNNFAKIESTFKEVKPAIITPQEADYDLGYYTRYFLQKITEETKMPIEIAFNEQELLGKEKGYDDRINDLIEIKWTLVGPLNTTIGPGGQIVEGIFERNSAEVLKAAQKYPNILYAFRNYTEFARPNYN